MKITRRDTAKLVLAGAASSAAQPALAFLHGAKPVDWPSRLQAELDAHLLPNCGGKLTLSGFGTAKRRGDFVMAAVIQLDWPPGKRSRRFYASGDDPEAVYSALLNKALFSFAKAWPGCVV